MKKILLFNTLALSFLAACSSDDNKSCSSCASIDNENLSAVVFSSDFSSGEIRSLDSAGNFSEKSITFYQDSKLFRFENKLLVLERLGKDNISLLDVEKLDEGNKAFIWQTSLDDYSNPTDVALIGENAWIALQGADSLIQISLSSGEIIKSINLVSFSNEKEISPYVSAIKVDGKSLYVLMQRYHYDAETWTTTFPKGLLAIYDASSGKLKDTLSLKTKNPTALALSNGTLYVATQGEFNDSYGTDADDLRGLEKIDLEKKSSKLFVDGKTLGGGIYSIAEKNGIIYAAIYKTFGDVPLVKIDLESGKVKTIKEVSNAEGSIACAEKACYVGDRIEEAVYKIEGDEIQKIELPEGMLSPYSIAVF